MSSAAARIVDESPKMRLIPRSALAHQSDGKYRGYGHIGFSDFPADAPGRLEWPHMLLAAQGELHPGEGFDMHPHDNVENIQIGLRGRFRHEDSLGNRWLTGPGDVTLMSAGSGMQHAEWVDGDDDVHGLVFILQPTERNTAPTALRREARPQAANDLVALVAGGCFADPGALPLRLDAALYGVRFDGNGSCQHTFEADRVGYLIAIDHAVAVNSVNLDAGARALLEGAGEVTLRGEPGAQAFLLDLPK